MTRRELYRKELATLTHWDKYLKEHSGLPGPRANLELLDAVAENGPEELLIQYVQIHPGIGPVESPECFLCCCGVAGLGRLIAEGRNEYWKSLREMASDTRWRVREAVAMALQRIGDNNMDRLLSELENWKEGNLLEKRAVMAGLCEPRLLKNPVFAGIVIYILDEITRSLLKEDNRKTKEFRILRQALGYGWSVAIAAQPEKGFPTFRALQSLDDIDIQWIVKENRKKKRLLKILDEFN